MALGENAGKAAFSGRASEALAKVSAVDVHVALLRRSSP